jgi:hypothetical protein
MRQFLTSVDRSIALVVGLLALVIHVGIHRKSGEPMETVFLLPIPLAFGMLPAVLLWVSTPLSLAVLVGYSVICCQGAYVACDAGPSDPWGVLHQAHDWLWLLLPYSIVRLLILGVMPKPNTSP